MSTPLPDTPADAVRGMPSAATLATLREVVHSDPYHRQFRPLLDAIDVLTVQVRARKLSPDLAAGITVKGEALREAVARCGRDIVHAAVGDPIPRATLLLTTLRQAYDRLARVRIALSESEYCLLTTGHPEFGTECTLSVGDRFVTEINHADPLSAILAADARLRAGEDDTDPTLDLRQGGGRDTEPRT